VTSACAKIGARHVKEVEMRVWEVETLSGQRSRQRQSTKAYRAVAVSESRLLALQRSVGNAAVLGLLASGPHAGRASASASPFLQRAASETTTADAGVPAAEVSESSDPAVDALDLQPKAKKVANKLKKKYPKISFTSGKRDEVSEQASAMAGNVVSNRNWITETYADKTLAKKLQDKVDANKDAKTKAEIQAILEAEMNTWDEKEKGKLSAHFTGEAFDIQPQTDQAAEIKSDAKTWAEADGSAGSKFLEKEGGLVRWHVQVRE
jgi:hypothetical protein